MRRSTLRSVYRQFVTSRAADQREMGAQRAGAVGAARALLLAALLCAGEVVD